MEQKGKVLRQESDGGRGTRRSRSAGLRGASAFAVTEENLIASSAGRRRAGRRAEASRTVARCRISVVSELSTFYGVDCLPPLFFTDGLGANLVISGSSAMADRLACESTWV